MINQEKGNEKNNGGSPEAEGCEFKKRRDDTFEKRERRT